jgi:hypothetical protein
VAEPCRAIHPRRVTKRLRRKRSILFSTKFSESMRNILRLSFLVSGSWSASVLPRTSGAEFENRASHNPGAASADEYHQALVIRANHNAVRRKDVDVAKCALAQCDPRSSERPDDARSGGS